MKAYKLIFSLVLVLTLSSFKTTKKQTFTVSVPFVGLTMNPCNGHLIQFNGNMMYVITAVANGNRTVTKTLAKPDGLIATDLITGDNYKALGMTIVPDATFSASGNNGQTILMGINNMIWVGEKGASFVLNQSGHIVLNAAGELTSSSVRLDFRCN